MNTKGPPLNKNYCSIGTGDSSLEENYTTLDPEILLMTYFHPDRNISKETVYLMPKLTIIEEKGNLLPNNQKVIQMNAQGILNIKGREKKDGLILFGLDEEKVDIKINLKDSKYSSYGYIFAIYFDKETNEYYIRVHPELQEKYKIMFAKINGKNNTYFLETQEYLILHGTIIELITVDQGFLVGKIIADKNNANQLMKPQTFNSYENALVTIGRDPKCSFHINNEKLSKIQCTIIYDFDNELWKLIDGTEKQNSRNGTWLLGNNSFAISNDLVVEILSSKFVFKLEFSK